MSGNAVKRVAEHELKRKYDRWHSITVLTDTALYTCGMPTGKRNTAMERLEFGNDTRLALAMSAPVQVVPIADLSRMEWHEDDTTLDLYCRSKTNDKEIKSRAILPDSESRAAMIQDIEQVAGQPFPTSETQASVWHTGENQLMISGVALVFTVLGAMIGSDDGFDPRKGPAGKGQGFVNLAYEIGSWGVIWIGLTIITAMMAWWCASCLNPATRFVARRATST